MKKIRRNTGFTLVEMLIVVAIIAILIAVSIPLVSNSLEKARDSTDQANERAAKAEANIVYLGIAYGELDFSADAGFGLIYYYDAESGKLVDDKGDVGSAYGKCTGATGSPIGGTKSTSVCSSTGAPFAANNYGSGNIPHEGRIIVVGIHSDGSVGMWWDNL